MSNDTNTAKKSKPFTNDEINLLQQLVLKYEDVLTRKSSDSYTVSSKRKVWQKIGVEFNAQALYIHRTFEQLKKRWNNMLQFRKKILTNEKQEQMKTGGGVSKVATTELSAMDLLLDKNVNIEIKLVQDSDSFNINPTSPQPFEHESAVQNNLIDETNDTTINLSILPNTQQPQETTKLNKSDDFLQKNINALLSESELRMHKLNTLIEQKSELFELEKKEKLLKIKLLEMQISKIENG